MHIPRKKFVEDISPRTPGDRQGWRVNLLKPQPKKRKKLALMFSAVAQAFFVAAAAWVLVFGSVLAPTATTAANDREAQRQELEAQIAELEAQIGEYESQVNKYRQQGKTLENEIARLNAQINSLQLRIRATNLTVQDISNEIATTEDRIDVLEKSLQKNAESLAELIRTMYKSDDSNLVEIFLKNPNLSGFFDDLNSLTRLQASVQVSIGEIRNLRADLQQQKEDLILARADAKTLQEFQEQQRQKTNALKQEKNELLEVTQGEESKYQTLLKETKETAAEIRSRLFELLGGGELTFEEAYNFAKLATSDTNVRPALVLAVLDRESALGRNVGSCSYQNSMHPTRDIPVFLEITKRLGLDPETVQVSCPILSDGAYGGAMGPAQFIPSTWAIYEPYIADVTGNNPPNPWNNADAFTATALYLQDSYGSQGCESYATNNDHILPHQVLRERCAAAKYYAGGNWHRYRFAYGDPVVERARQFQADIETITQ